MPYKVAITGEFRRGKDTLASMIEERLEGTVTRLAFADALKRELAEMSFTYVRDSFDLGRYYETIDGPEYDSVLDEWEKIMRQDRAINGVGWQWWGEFRRRKDGEDYWINHYCLAGQYAHASDHGHHIIITDMRHHNEAKWCKEHGFYLIRIEGPCQVGGELRDSNHPSERHVRELEVHLVIQNTGGLDALREKVASDLVGRLERFFDASVSD